MKAAPVFWGATHEVGMRTYDPYQKRFPRGRILNLYSGKSNVHRLRRDAYEPFFKNNNPQGYHHDLGAQDIFLDNFGLIFSEQFDDKYQSSAYMCTIEFLLKRWRLLERLVLPLEPWWGANFNSKLRQANAGEPRGLLRLTWAADHSVTSTMRH